MSVSYVVVEDDDLAEVKPIPIAWMIEGHLGRNTKRWRGRRFNVKAWRVKVVRYV